MPDFDSRGLVKAKGKEHCIITQSGWLVDPLNLRPGDVAIGDIAHSLSRQCRYNGHVVGFLSVARHSVWVCDHLWREHADVTLARWGLLHDASEAYLGDMVRPMKYASAMKGFRDAENRADETIAGVFNLPFPMPKEVHDADHYVTFELELKKHRATWSSTPQEDYEAFIRRFVKF